MSIENILKEYGNLPKHFLISFAVSCAKECMHLNTDMQVVRLMKQIELWLEGKGDEKELRAAIIDYYIVDEKTPPGAFYTASCVYAAARCVYAATRCVYNMPESSFIHAIYSVKNALGIPMKIFEDRFLNKINELTDLEKMLYKS